MEHNFWHQRWQNKQIGFHLAEANPLLVRHFARLEVKQGARLFLPLCGKTLDIAWLLNQGYSIVGVELSQIAIDELFANLGMSPKIEMLGDVLHYSANTPEQSIDIFVGDIFAVTPSMLGKVDAVFDRAALVALPEEMRQHYAMQIMALSAHAPQLLVCFVYDQSLQAGPPFSVDSTIVSSLYGKFYDFTLLENVTVDGGLKGVCPADEEVWLLQPKS